MRFMCASRQYNNVPGTRTTCSLGRSRSLSVARSLTFPRLIAHCASLTCCAHAIMQFSSGDGMMVRGPDQSSRPPSLSSLPSCQRHSHPTAIPTHELSFTAFDHVFRSQQVSAHPSTPPTPLSRYADTQPFCCVHGVTCLPAATVPGSARLSSA